MPTNKLPVEDFITKKSINSLSGVSVAIWIVTNISYNLMKIPFPTLSQQNYCTLTALALSVILGLYILRERFKTVEKLLKGVLIGINILLIYATANGVQAVYSGTFFQEGDIKPASGIPFVNTTPWWPDKQTSAENQVLKKEKVALSNRLETLNREHTMLAQRVDEFNKLQRQWQQKMQSNPDFSPMKSKITTFVGPEYYQKFFNTPIKIQ